MRICACVFIINELSKTAGESLVQKMRKRGNDPIASREADAFLRYDSKTVTLGAGIVFAAEVG
jgi:hypothetical protein